MKRRIALILLALVVAMGLTLVKPIADQPVVDSQKSRQELETMEGILSTTLGYAVKRLAGNEETEGRRFPRVFGLGGEEVSGYYVYGQGAIFMVPISALKRERDIDVAFAMPEVEAFVAPIVEFSLEAARAGLEVAKGTADSEEAKKEVEKAKQELEQAKQQAAEKQKDLAKNVEEQKAKMQQFQEQARKRRAEREERRKELISRMGQVKVDLKDALARYGDSLSVVKAEESVTIILTDDGHFRWTEGESRETCHVLTVKKSLVTDLKAGKITREEFDRRVVDYSY